MSFLDSLVQKVAKDQIQDKALEVAGEAIKKAIGGDDGKEDGEKKDSGFDVGGLLSKVTGGNDDNGGGLADTIGSFLK